MIEGDQLIQDGIARAIEYEVSWLERSGAFAIRFSNEARLPQANQEKDLIIFRVLQEVLNNVVRHAKASEIEITLRGQNGTLFLSVRDNGIGFDPAAGGEGMGIQNMRKRAGVIGGELLVSAEPGRGTEVMITIPYP